MPHPKEPRESTTRDAIILEAREEKDRNNRPYILVKFDSGESATSWDPQIFHDARLWVGGQVGVTLSWTDPARKRIDALELKDAPEVPTPKSTTTGPTAAYSMRVTALLAASQCIHTGMASEVVDAAKAFEAYLRG